MENEIINDIPVCLDVDLSSSKKINAKSLPEKSIPMGNYLSVVLPNVQIEYLGRPHLLMLGQDQTEKIIGLKPSSLFFRTLLYCFQNHYPLALRPEVLMYLIVNEVATTVNLYPEEYRYLFSKSQEKVKIQIRNDNLRRGDQNSPWYEVLEHFGLELQKNVPSDLMPSFLPHFSTATQETKAATMVAFMSAVHKFFDFNVMTLCGIPKIRLLGQADDYTKLRESAESLAKPFEKHLGRYFANLIPVLQTLEQQAQGNPIDEKFWLSLYNYESHSGSDRFNGWIAMFINYIEVHSGFKKGKSESSVGPKSNFDWQDDRDPGIDIGSVLPQISLAPFTWQYFAEELPMQFVAGVLGIDNVDGYATPALSYAITSV